jgi:hypothetical protein
MQVHGPSQIADRVSTYLNPGGGGKPFAVLEVGSVVIYVYTEAEADQLAAAAAEVKRLLLSAGEGDAK